MIQPAHSIPGTKAPCFAFSTNADVARHVAQLIANLIRERNSVGQNAVLGLPTGSTPIGVYRELIRMHREEGLDFSRVMTFNLDEYYGINPDRLQSYHRWMAENFFEHVNIPRNQVHVLDGTVSPREVEEHCRQFEGQIRRLGGLDIVLLGIGRNGHIGFNEPYGERHSRTRLITLDPVTRKDAASDFFHEDNVPTQALTMGIGTIFEARKVVLMAFGEHKARIIRAAVEGSITDAVPASYLREHPAAAVYVDQPAAAELTAVATPWILGGVDWTDALIKRAVLWLCEQTGKALLKLDGDDFRAHGLHQLLRDHGPAPTVAHRVFRWLMDTIEYKPAGRDPQRVLIFSPHPDDDVISMGGTIIRLVEDSHEAHVAYMTSGNIAVFDHDALTLADLVTEINRRFGIDEEKTPQLESQVVQSLASKGPGEPDHDTVLKIKALIRWSEAKAAAGVCGCKEEHLHFLDLPFYQTGTVAKKPITEDDVRMVRELIERIQPQQIYVAGDLSDPHGTHRVCADAIFQAIRQIEAETGTRPTVLLYRGAWQEWAMHVIDIAVPLSPGDLRLKKQAIFRHESQKDSALFPGPDDPREFWQRAEDRNRATADRYNRIGLPEYYAMEAFVRWDGRW
ncbi:MAG: glucosamine-6-phosphate deaminase [Patescibacteria group bacterium]|nr:glucosamine-6-phosphate deaminase [Patescibacteria group bacterium]